MLTTTPDGRRRRDDRDARDAYLEKNTQAQQRPSSPEAQPRSVVILHPWRRASTEAALPASAVSAATRGAHGRRRQPADEAAEIADRDLFQAVGAC
jgi:hypothetical protein